MKKLIKLTGLYVRLREKDFEYKSLLKHSKEEVDEYINKLQAFQSNKDNYIIKHFPILLDINEVVLVMPRIKLEKLQNDYEIATPKDINLGTNIYIRNKLEGFRFEQTIVVRLNKYEFVLQDNFLHLIDVRQITHWQPLPEVPK